MGLYNKICKGFVSNETNMSNVHQLEVVVAKHNFKRDENVHKITLGLYIKHPLNVLFCKAFSPNSMTLFLIKK